MMTVVVADDDDASRDFLREALTAIGYDPIPARDGREALDSIAALEPGLAILDIQMPYLNGHQVVRALRKDPRFLSLPVVALTAHALQEDREKAWESGFDAYLTKPINLGELRRQLDRLTGKKVTHERTR